MHAMFMQEWNKGCKIIKQEMLGSGHFSTEYIQHVSTAAQYCSKLKRFHASGAFLITLTVAASSPFCSYAQQIQMTFSASNLNQLGKVWHL